MSFIDENRKDRIWFVKKWANYVLKNKDKIWSKQQNVIINSNLKSAKMNKKDYLKMKQETDSK